ncbi:hypothetical protein GCM10022244_20470 [Streptomyces gulbargensis]|uniref:Uncharacterized protein n=1 Tax=Streptomyces gulbargensis TaxID=364901 RepID=A0ABP7M2I7_9ACTN
MKRTTRTTTAAVTARAGAAGLEAAAALVALGAPPASASPGAPPSAPTPEAAAAAPATLGTLARFFARDAAPAGAASAAAAAAPRVDGTSVPVRILSPDFVAGRPGAPVAREEYRASRAVAADGRKAALWTVRGADGWQVVNIATGDDEIRYAERGGRLLPGGLVFREPQIDAWYVQKGTKVLPLDEDATRAVGRAGTSLAAYRDRVARAYGDKRPGSAYARKGAAGGYAAGTAPAADAPTTATAGAPARTGGTVATAVSGAAEAGAVLALALTATAALRRRARAEG